MQTQSEFAAALPALLYEHARFILHRLHEAGHEAYVAGGAVRDHLLGRQVHDLDIATSASPSEVKQLFRRTVAVGEHFGVMIVMIEQHTFEVATFRSDHGYTDGRRPDAVRFCSAKEDVARRDFTINGMFWDPLEDKVYDWVEGRSDLARGLIRTIGSPDARFEEDKLRMLRAIRFAAQLDFEVEENTLAACRRLAEGLCQVSMERVREEFDRLFHAQAVGRGLDLLLETGLASVLAGRFCREAGFHFPPPERPYALLEAWARKAQPEGDGFAAAPWLCLLTGMCGVSADELGPSQWRELAGLLRAMCRALRLSNDENTELEAGLRVLCELPDGPTASLAMQKRLLRDPGRELALACLSVFLPGRATFLLRWVDEFLARYAEELHAAPLMNGGDLLSMGVEHGPEVGRLLRELEDAQLEHRLHTRIEAEAMVRQYLLNQKAEGEEPCGD